MAPLVISIEKAVLPNTLWSKTIQRGDPSLSISKRVLQARVAGRPLGHEPPFTESVYVR
jgi:hypothetical protein